MDVTKKDCEEKREQMREPAVVIEIFQRENELEVSAINPGELTIGETQIAICMLAEQFGMTCISKDGNVMSVDLIQD